MSSQPSHILKCQICLFQTIFEFEECVGVIGGRPNHALYFIGVVGDELLSIDPHVTQQAQNKVTQEDTDADATFHTDKCHRIDLKNVDPSLSLVSVSYNFNGQKGLTLLVNLFMPLATSY